MTLLKLLLVCCLSLLLLSCSLAQTPAEFEAAQTKKLLGIPIGDMSATGFEEIVVPLKISVQKQPLTGPTPLPSYEPRKFVKSPGPTGIVYDGFLGRIADGEVWPGPGSSSTNANPRQAYAPHYGMYFNPADVFIGKRERGKIRTSLFFRDVGSHETAPFHFTVDSRGKIHLLIADVNIYDENRLELYSLIGDPNTGKWLTADVLDRRGFTSYSYPWTGSWGDTVHLMWTWVDATYDKANPKMGLVYSEWSPRGYGKRVRLIPGPVGSYDAVIDDAGNLVVVAAVEYKIFIAMRTVDGLWKGPAEILPAPPPKYVYDVAVASVGRKAFTVRASGRDGLEWLVRIE